MSLQVFLKDLVRQELSVKEQRLVFVCYIYVSCEGIVSSSGFVVLSDRIVDIEHKESNCILC